MCGPVNAGSSGRAFPFADGAESRVFKDASRKRAEELKAEDRVQHEKKNDPVSCSKKKGEEDPFGGVQEGCRVLFVSGGEDWHAGVAKDLRELRYAVTETRSLSEGRQYDEYDLLFLAGDFFASPPSPPLAAAAKKVATLCLVDGRRGDADAQVMNAMLAGVREVVTRATLSQQKLKLCWQHTVKSEMLQQGLTPGPVHGKLGEEFILGTKTYPLRKTTSPLVLNIQRENRKRNHQSKRRERARGKEVAAAALRLSALPSPPPPASPSAALQYAAAAVVKAESPKSPLSTGEPPAPVKAARVIKRRRRNSWKMTHLVKASKHSACGVGGNTEDLAGGFHSSGNSSSGEDSPTMRPAPQPAHTRSADCQCELCFQPTMFPDSFLSLIQDKFDEGPFKEADLGLDEVANFEFHPYASLPDPQLVSQL